MAARKDFLTLALPAPRLNRRRWSCSAPAWLVLPAQRVAVAKPQRRRERLSRTLPEGSARKRIFGNQSIEPGRSESAPAFRLRVQLRVGITRPSVTRYLRERFAVTRASCQKTAPSHH